MENTVRLEAENRAAMVGYFDAFHTDLAAKGIGHSEVLAALLAVGYALALPVTSIASDVSDLHKVLMKGATHGK